MVTIKVAEIPYLNCAPFYWNKSGRSLSSVRFVWVQATPKNMGNLAREGKVDAGPISLVDSFGLEKDFEPLSNLGIAVNNAAKSVLLFSKKPIANLSGCKIGLTPHSVTSSELLKHILRVKYKAQADYHNGFNLSDDAQLRIGDEALKEISANRQFKYVIDLGEEWHSWQKLPFVFARWMVRKTVEPKMKLMLSQLLTRNLKSGMIGMKNMLQWYKESKGWNYSEAQKYLEEFQYCFGKKEKKAISVFRKLSTAFRRS